MSSSRRHKSTGSTRIRRLLSTQEGKCACGASINLSKYFDNGTNLRCGTCVLSDINTRA